MPKTLAEVTRDASELSSIERLKLARILLDLSEVDEQSMGENEALWEEEIQRRLRELRSGEVKGVPLEEVKKRIDARFAS